MSEAATLEAASKPAAAYEAEVDHYIREMSRLQEQIAASQRRTELLRVETEIMLQDALKMLKVS